MSCGGGSFGGCGSSSSMRIPISSGGCGGPSSYLNVSGGGCGSTKFTVSSFGGCGGGEVPASAEDIRKAFEYIRRNGQF